MNKGTLIISLDFELLWGVQDTRTVDTYGENVIGGRKAIPQLLELFKKHGIHASWATVGFQFAKNYDELKPFFPEKAMQPSYDNMVLSPYHLFGEIGKTEEDAPCFYGGSLVDLIASCEGQEIGSHTFSHYYCKESGQTVEQFDEDIKAALAFAESKGYNLKTAILPRNQCARDHIDILTKHGFIAFRDEENDWIHNIKFRPLMRILRLMDVYFPLTGQGGYIPKKENGIWNLMGSRMYKPYFAKLSFLENRKIKRIKKQMLHAAKNGLTFHFWWHPHNIGVMTDFHLKQLEEVFSYYDELKEKYGMQSLNMGEVVDMLENK